MHEAEQADLHKIDRDRDAFFLEERPGRNREVHGQDEGSRPDSRRNEFVAHRDSTAIQLTEKQMIQTMMGLSYGGMVGQVEKSRCVPVETLVPAFRTWPIPC
jgi:hypothetical protein